MFSVPLAEPKRSKWIEAIEKIQPFDYVVQTYHICSLHFLSEDIGFRGKNKCILPGKVPSIFKNNNSDMQKNLQLVDLNASDEHINREPSYSNSTNECNVYEGKSNASENGSFNIEFLDDKVSETNIDRSSEKINSNSSAISDT